jgi:hypothetical protein
MKANNQNISNALGVSPLTPAVVDNEPKEVTLMVAKENHTTTDVDYNYTRSNLYDIIEKGQGALDDMIEFARQAQHPRAYEVVATLLSNLVDANQKLLHLSKQVKDIKKSETKKDEIDNKITNNLFVGSTAELHKILKGE